MTEAQSFENISDKESLRRALFDRAMIDAKSILNFVQPEDYPDGETEFDPKSIPRGMLKCACKISATIYSDGTTNLYAEWPNTGQARMPEDSWYLAPDRNFESVYVMIGNGEMGHVSAEAFAKMEGINGAILDLIFEQMHDLRTYLLQGVAAIK